MPSYAHNFTMDTAPSSSILIKSSSCLLASDAYAHFEKIRLLFRAELTRFGYFGRFTVQVGFDELNGRVPGSIFVTLDSPLWGLSQSIVSARFSPIFDLFLTIQTPGTCYVLWGK